MIQFNGWTNRETCICFNLITESGYNDLIDCKDEADIKALILESGIKVNLELVDLEDILSVLYLDESELNDETELDDSMVLRGKEIERAAKGY